MEYISTRNSKKIFTFRDVFLKGLAPDGGLFVPKSFPKFTTSDFESLRSYSYKELAEKIVYKFCSDEFTEKEIKNLKKISLNEKVFSLFLVLIYSMPCISTEF